MSGQLVAELVNVGVPPVGTEIIVDVPAGESWRFMSGHAVFAAGAGVANRNLTLNVNSGPSGAGGLPANTEWWAELCSQIVTNGQVIDCAFDESRPLGVDFNAAQPGAFITGVMHFSLPSFWLPPLGRLKTGVINLQAADQWQGPVVFLVQKLKGSSIPYIEA